MKRLALTAMVGASLVGCAAEPVQLEQNRSYILEWIGERPLMDYSHLTITLGEDGRAYGNGGCNHWFAPYTLQTLCAGPDGAGKTLPPGTGRRAALGCLVHRPDAFLACRRQAAALVAGRGLIPSKPVGAGLPAKASLTISLDCRTSSLASQLLHGLSLPPA